MYLNDATCYGYVVDGTCRKCGAVTFGIAQYCYDIQLADLNDEKSTIVAHCADGAGKAMFNMDASAFYALSATAKADAKENMLCKPVVAKANAQFKVESDQFINNVYDVTIA